GIALLVVLWGWIGAAALAPNGPGARGGSLHAEAGAVEFLNVSVTDDLHFVLSSDQVTPGASVEVVVNQLGTVAHTFTIDASAGHTFPQTDGATQLASYFSAHPPLLNIVVGTTTGGKYYGNFTAPAYGLYEYVCTQPGHFPTMSGILGSGEAGSTLSVNTGPGAPVFIIAGTITGLVILALVLGFVIGRRRGAAEEMPPERLGYPEPPPPPKTP
ncbi:MAG TPA: hypothetical protein VGV64_04840, partial [Thermoplasmata archaeon]|nr:hypothetical protein [Thermoplasmata archaeon]